MKTNNFAFKFFAVLLFSLFVSTAGVFAQTGKSPDKAPAEPVYDAELAGQLGADEYGMRSFVLVILKTGPAKITDEKKRKELFEGHFANMGRLAKEGKLVLAGPFVEGGENRGLFVFDVKTIEEARALVDSDPSVKAGIFKAELIKWYGSAALLKIHEIHSKIQKTPVN
ncbi:MAG: YciI family protein [Pyrinomonadaceae bacterium]